MLLLDFYKDLDSGWKIIFREYLSDAYCQARKVCQRGVLQGTTLALVLSAMLESGNLILILYKHKQACKGFGEHA